MAATSTRSYESTMELIRGAKATPNGENWLKLYAAIFDRKQWNFSPWTTRENDFVIKNYGVLTNAELSSRLNRSMSAVKKRISEFKRDGKI